MESGIKVEIFSDQYELSQLTAQSTLLRNITLALGSGVIDVPTNSVCGRVAPSSSLTSYVTTTYANIDFSSFAAKNRPGLVNGRGQHTSGQVRQVTYHACRPCPNARKSDVVETKWCFAPSPSSLDILENRKGSNTCAFG